MKQKLLEYLDIVVKECEIVMAEREAVNKKTNKNLHSKFGYSEALEGKNMRISS
jgi:hypothetical protein